MLGAIVGDIIGSSYEFKGLKSTKFPLFTSASRFSDDTVLTIAVADCILHNRDYAKTFKEYGQRYPHAGYGGRFGNWLQSTDIPLRQRYHFGNKSNESMRPGIIIVADQEISDDLGRLLQQDVREKLQGRGIARPAEPKGN